MERLARSLPALCVLALAAQAALLALLAGFGTVGAALAAPAGLAAGRAVVAGAGRRAPDLVAMLALGGFGMTLGWWVDLGAGSAAAVAPVDTVWCRSSQAHLGVCSWMNAGMLAFGLPAVVAAQRRRGLCGHRGPALLLCGAGMTVGMSAGSALAARLAGSLGPGAFVPVHFALMTAGMLAAMALLQMPRHAAIATRAQPSTVTRNPAAPA
jgi:hypothetical protein